MPSTTLQLQQPLFDKNQSFNIFQYIVSNPQNIFESSRQMSVKKQQLGVMDESHVVPKSEILSWINNLLEINITKIQTLGSGSIYCQIFDVIHNGKINLSKVNWKAKHDIEFVANFKILKAAFDKVGIKKNIEVVISLLKIEKLIKAKYQDNMQFIQWFKKYFDTNCIAQGEGYDPAEKRNKVVPDFTFSQKPVVSKTVKSHNNDVPSSKHMANSPTFQKNQNQSKVKISLSIKTPNRKSTGGMKIVEHQKVEAKEIKKPSTTVEHSRGTILHKNLADKHDTSKKIESSNSLNTKRKGLAQMLEMIKEIVSSQDGSDMKIDLIKEVLKISKLSQENLHSAKNSQIKPAKNASHQQQKIQIASTEFHEQKPLSEQPSSEETPLGQPLIENPTVQQQNEKSLEVQLEDSHQVQLEEKPNLSDEAVQENQIDTF